MDLLGERPVLNFSDKSFRIFSRNFARPPQYVGKSSYIRNSFISEGCTINGTVENSVLSGGVVVEAGAVVRDSVIMEDVVIKKNAKVFSAIIDAETLVSQDAVVGNEGASKDGVIVVGKGSKIPKSAKVKV